MPRGLSGATPPAPLPAVGGPRLVAVAAAMFLAVTLVVAGDTAGHDSPLLADDLAERVTITPHVGAQTVEAIDEMGRLAVENALAVLNGQQPPNAVGHGR